MNLNLDAVSRTLLETVSRERDADADGNLLPISLFPNTQHESKGAKDDKAADSNHGELAQSNGL